MRASLAGSHDARVFILPGVDFDGAPTPAPQASSEVRIRCLRRCIRQSRFATALSGSSDARSCASSHMPSFMQAATNLMPSSSVCSIDAAVGFCSSWKKVEYSLLSFVLRTYSSPARWERRQLIQTTYWISLSLSLSLSHTHTHTQRDTHLKHLPC